MHGNWIAGRKFLSIGEVLGRKREEDEMQTVAGIGWDNNSLRDVVLVVSQGSMERERQRGLIETNQRRNYKFVA